MIKEIIEKLTCKHKWEIHYTTDIIVKFGEPPVGRKQTLICKECWKIKKITL